MGHTRIGNGKLATNGRHNMGELVMATVQTRTKEATLVLATVILTLALAFEQTAHAVWIGSGTGGEWTDTTNWDGGIIDDYVDSTTSSSGHLIFTFADDHATVSNGLRVLPGGTAQWITLRGVGGNRTVTLNGNVQVDRPGHGNFFIGSNTNGEHLNLDLGGQMRTFSGYSGDTLTIRNDVLNGGVNAAQSGWPLVLEGTKSYTGESRATAGRLVITGTSYSTLVSAYPGGTVQLRGTDGVAPYADVLLRGGRVQLGTGTGNNNNRLSDANTVYLERGGSLYLQGVNSGSTTETVSVAMHGPGSIEAHHGSGTADTAVLTANLNRDLKSVLRVAGTNLGASSGAHSQILLTPAPAVHGGGGGSGSTNISIVPWIYGGSAGAWTFGTYSQAGFTGVGLLDTATEFVTGGSGGDLPAANADDNVRVTFSSNGILTLAGDRTVNSLVLIGMGLNHVNGAGHTLSIDSGGLIVQAHNNPFNINVSTIDFGSSEGVINFAHDAGANGRLVINSAITGSDGLSLRASRLNTTNPGQIELAGNNSYTGPTTISYGRVVTSGNERIPDGGTIRLGPSAELAIGAGNTETVAGLAGTGAFRLTDSSSQLIVGSGAGTGGAVTMNAGGSIGPGLSIGTLNIGDPAKGDSVDFMMNGGDLFIEIGPDSIDMLNVTGDATINGGVLNLSFVDGFFPERGETYTFLTANSVSGSLFSAVNAPAFMYAAIDGDSIVAFIPEPTTLGLFSLLAAGLALRRPRSRRES